MARLPFTIEPLAAAAKISGNRLGASRTGAITSATVIPWEYLSRKLYWVEVFVRQI
jgi:hypothetical protein